jgi:hypothetical protein
VVSDRNSIPITLEVTISLRNLGGIRVLFPAVSEEGKKLYQSYHKGQSFDAYMGTTLKAKSAIKFVDRGKVYGIFYFGSQEDLHRCMESPHPILATIPFKVNQTPLIG